MTPIHADTLKLTSLHWPPYSGSQLKEQGATIAITRAALKAEGHELVVDFYPWSRAIRLVGRAESDYLGYIPAYVYPTESFLFSDPLAASPLGLVEQQLHPINWLKTDDLNQYTIGVVRDYVNTSELDMMIKQGTQPVEVVNSDEHNIKKVASGRINAAVIDVHVLNYILARGDLASLSEKLQINKKLLEEKHLYIAFKNNDEGKAWRDRLNRGLARIDTKSIIEKYMSSTHTNKK